MGHLHSWLGPGKPCMSEVLFFRRERAIFPAATRWLACYSVQFANQGLTHILQFHFAGGGGSLSTRDPAQGLPEQLGNQSSMENIPKFVSESENLRVRVCVLRVFRGGHT